MTFHSRCWGNTITTTTSNAEYYAYNIDSSGDYVDPVFTAAETHASCHRTCTFEVWDEETETWRLFSTGSAPYTSADLYTSHPWASVATDGSCRLSISLSSSNTFWTVAMGEHRKDWKVRMSVEDLKARDAKITDYYTVSLGHHCSYNKLELATPTLSQPNFLILTSGDGTGGKVVFNGHHADNSISRTVSTCPILCQLEIYHEVNNYWEVYSPSGGGATVTPSYVANFDTSDCSWDLIVPASHGPTYSPANAPPDIIYLRYRIWDRHSDQPDEEEEMNGWSTIFDSFDITMNYACSDDSVTI